MHRIVFHFEPEDGIGARLHWIIHGVHHDHPNDRMRLVMPPSVSVPLAIVFYVLFLLVLGGTVAPAFGAGFLVGYLIYDMTHYHVHHHTPRTRAGTAPARGRTCAITSRTTRAGFGVSAPVVGPRLRHGAEARGAIGPAPTGCIATNGLCRARARGYEPARGIRAAVEPYGAQGDGSGRGRRTRRCFDSAPAPLASGVATAAGP